MANKKSVVICKVLALSMVLLLTMPTVCFAGWEEITDFTYNPGATGFTDCDFRLKREVFVSQGAGIESTEVHYMDFSRRKEFKNETTGENFIDSQIDLVIQSAPNFLYYGITKAITGSEYAEIIETYQEGIPTGAYLNIRIRDYQNPYLTFVYSVQTLDGPITGGMVALDSSTFSIEAKCPAPGIIEVSLNPSVGR